MKNNKSVKLNIHSLSALSAALLLGACAPQMPRSHNVPSAEYASRVKKDYAQTNPDFRARMNEYVPVGERSAGMHNYAARAAIHNVNDQAVIAGDDPQKMVSNIDPDNQILAPDSDFSVTESTNSLTRDYRGPLSLGEPGVGSSLWRENKSLDLIRDVRAFQPMDLITIMVEETTEGKREADTDIKQESTLSASITSLFGLDDSIIKSNPQIANGANTNLEDIAGAEFKSDFKGEGETTRKGSLKGRISAMVIEVLPSGILRVEGEKIVSVNNEDEIMVISGLIRPEDVNSYNEVRSSKLANMRIDYFGQGTVGDAQVGGWLSRILRRLWPL